MSVNMVLKHYSLQLIQLTQRVRVGTSVGDYSSDKASQVCEPV